MSPFFWIMNNFQLYETLHVAANKDVYSNWLRPARFELELKKENVRLMRTSLGLPERYQPGAINKGASMSRTIEADLSPFLMFSNDGYSVSNQLITLDNWYYINDFYTEESLDPEIISQQELGGRIHHPIRIATAKYPWAVIVKEGLKVYPDTISKAWVSWYRYPVEPVFATRVNETTGALEYDAVNSVDLEWREESQYDILYAIMQTMGVNIERPDLEALAQKLVEGGK